MQQKHWESGGERERQARYRPIIPAQRQEEFLQTPGQPSAHRQLHNN